MFQMKKLITPVPHKPKVSFRFFPIKKQNLEKRVLTTDDKPKRIFGRVIAYKPASLREATIRMLRGIRKTEKIFA